MNWLAHPLFSIGRTQVTLINLGLFLVAVVAVVVISRMIGKLVGSRLLSHAGLDAGLQYAIGRMTYYFLLVLGLMIALQTSGIEVGSLTVLLGALGVGIGFGLQNIVNNFVSGLILLVERPVQVGDWIEVGGIGGRVEHIGARSTSIVTTDNISMIVPNADLVTQRIVNWSHGDPKVRFRIPVGVAYGSDIARVRQALLEVAAGHPGALRDPPPTVFFNGFGDSSLKMELVVWTRDMVQTPFRFRSELNFSIDAAFRRYGIHIPFPQRDVHFKTGRIHLAPPAGDESGRE